MRNQNKTSRMVTKLKSLPLGSHLVSLALCRMIPFIGTAGVEILEITQDCVRVRIKNQRRARNHIGQVHAAAMMLIAETASGLLVGMNTLDSSLPLLKEMSTKFIKRSSGHLVATARLQAVQQALFADEKSEILIEVEVKDESGEAPVLVQATWAWVPKKKNV